MFTVSIIGIGNRGGVYAQYLAENKDVKIVAGCDIVQENALSLNTLYGVDKANLFTDEKEFFAKKRSDVLVIATMDRLHLSHSIKALELGYDILLEKPIAPTFQDMMEIENTAKKYNRSVVICHNLRYTPFYQNMKKLVLDDKIGDIVNFEQSENVAYFHFIQSFVRGNWHNSQETSPIILQKCCHDLDLIYWFINKKCKSICSYGSLSFYNHDNMPKGASKKCVDCKYTDCTYNAYGIYSKYTDMMPAPFGFERTKENIRDYLSQDDNNYGKCVYNSDNDVCDRQIVSMVFDGGVTANLIMQGFAGTTTHRITRIYGTKGVIEGCLNDGIIHIQQVGKKPTTLDINNQIITNSHDGGDAKLIVDYVSYMNGGKRPLGISMLSDSIYSHRLAFSAEESRLHNGKEMSV